MALRKGEKPLNAHLPEALAEEFDRAIDHLSALTKKQVVAGALVAFLRLPRSLQLAAVGWALRDYWDTDLTGGDEDLVAAFLRVASENVDAGMKDESNPRRGPTDKQTGTGDA